MVPTLYLTPTTETALAHAASQIQAARETNPLAPGHLLLPSADAIDHARHSLGSTVGLHLVQFYALGRHILDKAGVSVYELSDTAVRRLVHHLLQQMAREQELTTFAAAQDKPGFIQVLVEWLREMKSQGIDADAVLTHAASSGRERDQQLALLYQRCQAFLHQQHYSDTEGMLWLAAEALEANPRIYQEASPFLILGFDQFTPVQLRILHQLAKRMPGFGVYLLWDQDRPEDSLALTRLRQTRQELLAALQPDDQILEDNSTVAPALSRLRQRLFEPAAEPATDAASIHGYPPAVEAIAAPSREAEVRWALRSIKQRLLDGAEPAQIALLAPQPAAYKRLVESVAGEYGLPIRYEQSLGNNPAVIALLNLLNLAPDFPWRETFDALRSPYVEQPWLTAEQINLLDQLSRERPVVAGRSQWRFALQPLQLDESAQVDDEDLGPPPLVARLEPEILAGIEQGLMAFFDHLTAPATASYHDYALWLQEAILGLLPEPAEPGESPALESPASLHVVACCQAGEFAQRDVQAMGLVLRAGQQLVQAADVVPATSKRVSWSTYRSELARILVTAVIPPSLGRAAVRFGPLEAGRATIVDHLLVLGLAEGEFPQPPAADALYAPFERAAHPLPLAYIDPAENASLWWQVIGNCRRSLTLLRPRLDEAGAPWQPSPYWEAVLDQVAGVREQKPPLATPPAVADAASPAELLVALAHANARHVPPELERPWQAARRAYEVIQQRQSWQPPGVYEGVLQAPALQVELAGRYGPEYVWSASRLNRYGLCPYGFFAEAVLKLEPRPDPEEGLDALQRGSLIHAVLEQLYRRLTADELLPTNTNQEAVLACLEECCEALFPTAPQRYGFRPGALWRYEQQELRRMLQALVAWECERNGDKCHFHPYRQELRFGIADGLLPHLRLDDGNGTVFYLQGVIDRLDRDADGRVKVIDYKSGSTSYSKPDIQRGVAFQTALYALAAEQLVNEVNQVAESYYVLVPKRDISGRLPFSMGATEDEVVQVAVAQAAAFVRQVRAGVFPSAPTKPVAGGGACRNACDLAGLCRTTRLSTAKARQQI